MATKKMKFEALVSYFEHGILYGEDVLATLPDGTEFKYEDAVELMKQCAANCVRKVNEEKVKAKTEEDAQLTTRLEKVMTPGEAFTLDALKEAMGIEGLSTQRIRLLMDNIEGITAEKCGREKTVYTRA